MKYLILLLLAGCTQKTIIDQCEGQPFSVETTNQGAVEFPKKGKMVEESHYRSLADTMKSYPKTVTENILPHLEASCNYLKAMNLYIGNDCSDIYKNRWEREWTPSEGGNIGQGSVGNNLPSMAEEVWQGNMMLKKNFPIGTRLIAKFDGKAVVLAMGREIGPSSSKYLGGMSVESHWSLGTNNESTVELIYPKNQNLDYGPLTCLKEI